MISVSFSEGYSKKPRSLNELKWHHQRTKTTLNSHPKEFILFKVAFHPLVTGFPGIALTLFV